MEKRIISVTCDGIDYIDEQGNPQYVDFQRCYDAWLVRENSRTDPYYDGQIDPEWREVGHRDLLDNPPYIEFYTDPITR
ncbi:MAG TPA: hypothetical protein VHL11_13085, partial [Phototrophicaceae bacterium]|nr:hypothetical protein [Phototrophicaceae bacterium]